MLCNRKFNAFEEYLRQISGQNLNEKERGELHIQDHNYVKHYSAHPDSHRTRPARMLFMNSVEKQKRKYPCPAGEIDVVTVSSDSVLASPFHTSRSKILAYEIERSFLSNVSVASEREKEEEDHHELLIATASIQEKRIYSKVMTIIKNNILEELVSTEQTDEYVKKKLSVEKAAMEMKLVFANAFWDFSLILCIHKFILDKCDLSVVSSYLNILQALRAKVPTAVDKIIKTYCGKMNYENVSEILKKHTQYDPIVPVLNQHKRKKLPGNPFMLIIAGYDLEKSEDSSRFRFLRNHLNTMCRNTMHFPINVNIGCMEKSIEETMASLYNKIMELKKKNHPTRPVILAGWNIGALIACYVALKTPVNAIVCFGFPLIGVNGLRGDMHDILLENEVPTLFCIGENSALCTIDEMEDFRSRFKGETGLIIVSDGDDMLRVSPKKLIEENITQHIVDHCILDEVGDFLQSILVKLPSVAGSTHISSNQTKICPTILEENADFDIEVDDRKNAQKKRRPKELPSELLSSRKRRKYSVTKEEIPTKSRPSPSSSETSSSSSSKIEKQKGRKSAKKIPDKRTVGRPPRSTSRKKSPPKPVVKQITEPVRHESLPKRANKVDVSKPVPPSPPKAPLIPAPKKTTLPFALNILPKKNDPVDVEKAFGKDSSFLPRPLTPPEPEDTVSAEETEKAMAELESSNSVPLEPPKCHTSSAIPVPQITSISEKSFMPLTEQSPITVLASKGTSGSIIKPIINSYDVKKSIAVTVAPAAFKTVFQQSKVLNSGSVSNLKNITGVKLISSNLNQTSKTVNTTKTMLTVPSSSATILVSGSTIKTKSGKVFQLLAKRPISLKAKDPSSLTSQSPSSVISKVSHEHQPLNLGNPAEQQVCNLSLLSDVAGMKEPLKDTSRKLEPSTSATLVKLAVPDKPQPQHIKRIRIFKALQNRPAPARVETPEEMVEKQLAIQALNKSIGVESPIPHTHTLVKESGYSICYAPAPKTNPSVVPRAISHRGQPYIARQPVISQPPSARGRARPILPTYRFYHT